MIIRTILIIAFAAVSLTSCKGTNSNPTTQDQGQNSLSATNNQKSQNVLIVYFSHSGNTEIVANKIHEKIGGDIFEINTVNPYSQDYNTVVEQAKQELAKNFRPKLAKNLEQISQYDTIILGYPNWWSTMPMPVFTFLESHDFSGKTILPICTHEGSRMGRSVEDIRKVCPKAIVINGLAIRGSNVSSADNEITEWLRQNGLD